MWAVVPPPPAFAASVSTRALFSLWLLLGCREAGLRHVSLASLCLGRWFHLLRGTEAAWGQGTARVLIPHGNHESIWGQ